MQTSINWLIKTQVSILLIKQQVWEIIDIVSMHNFSYRMVKKKFTILPITFISGEPLEQGMPFSKAITDGVRAVQIHSYAWKLQQVIWNTLQIPCKGCIGQVCMSVWKNLCKGGEFQGGIIGKKLSPCTTESCFASRTGISRRSLSWTGLLHPFAMKRTWGRDLRSSSGSAAWPRLGQLL